MSDCLPSTFIPHSCIRTRQSRFSSFNWKPKSFPVGVIFRTSTKARKDPGPSRLAEHDFYDELGFMKKHQEKGIELEAGGNVAEETKTNSRLRDRVENPGSSDVAFLEFDEKCRDDNLVSSSGVSGDGFGTKMEELEKKNAGQVLRKGRQLTNRSSMMAKQVISIQSALSLGFISQLWVDTNSWTVMVVEVRPNLLSGELERLLLEDISQVGDVVLIQDESMMENGFKMVGLETLVGYNVVTPGRRNIGKVRGYTFNINSGAVELLELDSFGISIIPSSLVSTYGLFVEDVLEVVADTVVVHEAAASRVQRLTKGFWDAQKVRNSSYELEEYPDLEKQPLEGNYGRVKQRRSSGRNSRPKTRDVPDDWELPMDYL
ncbi:hypothetical protein RJ640_010365 [Escallonia rubra]|uniref:PRC-barrel domain-containing protein n=1 Tax=Escallonia rubra TaxID=112253 RepID=A0AA88R9D7_9ASTE|nr:hypothetical protein RJ640_010365 [Escallonia rubra]